jgi:hypothetical protein
MRIWIGGYFQFLPLVFWDYDDIIMIGIMGVVWCFLKLSTAAKLLTWDVVLVVTVLC